MSTTQKWTPSFGCKLTAFWNGIGNKSVDCASRGCIFFFIIHFIMHGLPDRVLFRDQTSWGSPSETVVRSVYLSLISLGLWLILYLYSHFWRKTFRDESLCLGFYFGSPPPVVVSLRLCHCLIHHSLNYWEPLESGQGTCKFIVVPCLAYKTEAFPS